MSASAETGLVAPEKRDAPRFITRAVVFVREHPYMVGLLVSCTVAGAAFGALVPMGELGMLRRVLGGAVAGLYFGLFPLGYRLFE